MQSFWVLTSCFLTALTYVFVKLAPAGFSFYEIFFVRAVFMTAAVVVLGLVPTPGSGVTLRTRHPVLHFSRVASGITALTLNLIVLRHLTLATTQTLAFTAPLFIAAFVIMRGLVTGKMPDWRLIFTVAAGFGGVCLTMQPSFTAGLGFYAVLGLISGACSGCANLSIKALGNHREPVLRTVSYFALGSLLYSAVLVVMFSNVSLFTILTDPMLCMVGVCTALAQFAQTQGWGCGRTLLCASLQFSAIIFGTFFGALIFGETPGTVGYCGIAVIIVTEVAATYLQFNGNKAEKNAQSAKADKI